MTKTERSIKICWALNNAVQTLSEKDKDSTTPELSDIARKKIKERCQYFMNIYDALMNLTEKKGISDNDYQFISKVAEIKEQMK
jgi:homoserine trans-succinylase